MTLAPRSPLATALRAELRLPVMAGPMFIASTADLVIAQCKAEVIGANASFLRPSIEANGLTRYLERRPGADAAVDAVAEGEVAPGVF